MAVVGEPRDAVRRFAIIAHGGYVPALRSALRGAGIPFDGVYNNSVANDQPRLA